MTDKPKVIDLMAVLKESLAAKKAVSSPPVVEPEWGEPRRSYSEEGNILISMTIGADCECWVRLSKVTGILSGSPCGYPHTFAHLVSGEAKLREAIRDA